MGFGILGDLIYGYRRIRNSVGDWLPQRTDIVIKGAGVSVEDNPALKQTEITIPEGAIPLSDDLPKAPGTASAGSAVAASRADHKHPAQAHGEQAGGSLHAAVTDDAAGFATPQMLLDIADLTDALAALPAVDTEPTPNTLALRLPSGEAAGCIKGAAFIGEGVYPDLSSGAYLAFDVSNPSDKRFNIGGVTRAQIGATNIDLSGAVDISSGGAPSLSVNAGSGYLTVDSSGVNIAASGTNKNVIINSAAVIALRYNGNNMMTVASNVTLSTTLMFNFNIDGTIGHLATSSGTGKTLTIGAQTTSSGRGGDTIIASGNGTTGRGRVGVVGTLSHAIIAESSPASGDWVLDLSKANVWNLTMAGDVTIKHANSKAGARYHFRIDNLSEHEFNFDSYVNTYWEEYSNGSRIRDVTAPTIMYSEWICYEDGGPLWFIHAEMKEVG